MLNTDLAPAGSSPLVTWNIPVVPGEPDRIVHGIAGRATVIVGANGAGKSALGHWMEVNSTLPATRRVIAHRKLWFSSAGPDISPAQRESTVQGQKSWGKSPNSRYLDHVDSQRTGIVLFDLLGLMNGQNSRIADRALGGAPINELLSVGEVRVLDKLNLILSRAGLPVKLRLTDTQTFNAVNSLRNVDYPIFQMSDGEKSAVLLASEVLSAEKSSVIIIDEPERHLHRSISSGLVQEVVASRPDCHFVVLTHDLELASALDDRQGSLLIVAGCTWRGETASHWSFLEPDPEVGVPDVVRLALLGGRKDLLFVEGVAGGLDVQLYSILYPGWLVTPVGGAEQVIRAVTGLKSSVGHHWVRGCGIIDGDGLSSDERDKYRAKAILALPVSEVENLLYLPEVFKMLAGAQARIRDFGAADLERACVEAGLASLRASGVFERMVSQLALAEVRLRMAEALPDRIDSSSGRIEFSLESPFERIMAEVSEISQRNDLSGLIQRLPIRDSAFRSRVARALAFQGVADYEVAALVGIRKDDALRGVLQTIVGPLPVHT